jgi:monofunctional glycosyltransferase
MAKQDMAKRTPKQKTAAPLRRPLRWVARKFMFGLGLIGLVLIALLALFKFVNPPTTFYMWQESRRLGGVKHEWVDFENIAAVMPRSAVAAEDANFCLHLGFDMGAIRAAIDAGSTRGASTISQQVAKNVFLWQGRNYTRKALEAVITLAMEMMWSKRRILEVYLNVAEFDEGVFGVKAAAAQYFAVEADDLTAVQAARLAAVLPNPKKRDAENPSAASRKRSAAILDGAKTILNDGRSACFDP